MLFPFNWIRLDLDVLYLDFPWTSLVWIYMDFNPLLGHAAPHTTLSTSIEDP